MIRFFMSLVLTVVSQTSLSFLVFNRWPAAFPMLRDMQLSMLGLWVGLGGRRWYARYMAAVLVAPLSIICLAFHPNYGWETFLRIADISWVTEKVLPSITLPALLISLLHPREIKRDTDNLDLSPQRQYGLRSAFVWTCGIAFFFAATLPLSSSVTMNVPDSAPYLNVGSSSSSVGYVGSSSTHATFALKGIVLATWSSSIALLAIAVMYRNRNLTHGIPSILALFLVAIIPWLLFAGGGISTRLPNDYLGSVVLGRFNWALGWALAYSVAFLTFFVFRTFGFHPTTAAPTTPDNKVMNQSRS